MSSSSPEPASSDADISASEDEDSRNVSTPTMFTSSSSSEEMPSAVTGQGKDSPDQRIVTEAPADMARATMAPPPSPEDDHPKMGILASRQLPTASRAGTPKQDMYVHPQKKEEENWDAFKTVFTHESFMRTPSEGDNDDNDDGQTQKQFILPPPTDTSHGVPVRLETESRAGTPLMEVGEYRTSRPTARIQAPPASKFVQPVQRVIPRDACQSCGKPLSEDQEIMRATKEGQELGLYHLKCFKCVTCSECLHANQYVLENGHLYCIADFYRRHAKRCYRCDDYIVPKNAGEKVGVVEATGHYFHVDCFRCYQCKRNLLDHDVTVRSSHLRLFCQDCYKLRQGTTA